MYQSSILYYETIYFSKFEIFLPLITHNLYNFYFVWNQFYTILKNYKIYMLYT